MTCKDCIYAVQPTTTMRCRNHGINMSDNAVVCNEFKSKPQTNGDRIRAMSDEELSDFLEGHCYQYGWLEWLKMESKE